MRVPVTRPRVHLIDFEVAVSFESDCPASERMCTGYPIGGSFSRPEMYSRPKIPEMESGAPWDPFKLDVMQLGLSIQDFKASRSLVTGP